jgi:probable O-glycosylation ligase (exosortase A-associated)
MSKLALLFLLTYLSGLILVITRNPVWGVYIYELVYFLNPDHRWWSSGIPDIKYSFTVVLVTFAAYFIQRNSFQNNTLREAPQTKWFVFIIIIYILIYFASLAPEYHQKYTIDLFKLFLIMYLAYKVLDTENKVEYALYAYIIGAAYIGYEAYTVGRNEFGRVEGIGTVDAPDSNGIAAAIVPTIPIMLYFFWQKNTAIKSFITILGLIIVNGLVLINSRGAFLGALTGFLYLISSLIFSRYKLPKQRIIIIAFLAGSLLTILNITDDAFWERMSTLQTHVSKEDVDASGGRRINFWLATFDILKDYPLGVGIFGYQTISPNYLDEELLAVPGRGRAVHSLWFQGLSEIGWLGFIVFISLLISVYRYSRRAKIHALKLNYIKQYYFVIAIEGGLLAFLVAGSFINAFRAQILYWIIIFLISISTIILRCDNKMPEADD